MPRPTAIVLHPNDGCLTMARALVRRGVAVHLLPTPDYAYVLAARGVTGRVMPAIGTHPDEWSTELNSWESAAVLSGSDAATEWLARHRGELAPGLRTFESADSAHLGLMDKLTLYRTANAAEVKAPWMFPVHERADLDAELDGVTFPCVVKPTFGHVAKQLLGTGTVRAGSRAELVTAAAPLLDHEIQIGRAHV